MDEFEFDGKTYIAKHLGDACGCVGCAFEFDAPMRDTCWKVACVSEEREDSIDVIFIESPQNETQIN